MTVTNTSPKIPQSIRVLRRISRIISWVLLANIVLLVVSGWGITHSKIISTVTFGLVGRGEANFLHRTSIVPFGVLLLGHVLIGLRFRLIAKRPERRFLINNILIAVGVLLTGLFIYMQYVA